MSSTENHAKAVLEQADPTYKPLYRVGGIAAVLMVLLTLLHSAVFFASRGAAWQFDLMTSRL